MKSRLKAKCGWLMAALAWIGGVFGLGVPTDLAVAPIDYTQEACNIDCSARLSWAAPAEGTPTGYRIYRRTAAHEQPTLAGTVEAGTTSFTDSTATVGEAYLYTVTALDAEGESAESASVSFRKVQNVMLGALGYGSWNSYTDLRGPSSVLNDGALGTLSGVNGGGVLAYTFSADKRPKLVYARVRPAAWGENLTQHFYGKVWRETALAARKFNGNPTDNPWTQTANAWNGWTLCASTASGRLTGAACSTTRCSSASARARFGEAAGWTSR